MSKSASYGIGEIIGVLIGAIALILIAPLLGVIGGAFAGWVVGMFFHDTIFGVLTAFGVHTSLPLWQIGATLGFVSGFFKSSCNCKS